MPGGLASGATTTTALTRWSRRLITGSRACLLYTSYVHRHLLAARRALQEGYPLIGYTYWSIMDNYEWAEGYSKRFGLIYVDYRTMERIPKDSAAWYAHVIATNGSEL